MGTVYLPNGQEVSQGEYDAMQGGYLPAPAVQPLTGEAPAPLQTGLSSLAQYQRNYDLGFANKYNLTDNAQPDMGTAPEPVGLNRMPSASQRLRSRENGMGVGTQGVPDAALRTPAGGSSGSEWLGAAGSAAAGAGSLISALGAGGGEAALATTGAAAAGAGGAAAGVGLLGTLAAAAPVIGAVGGLVALGVNWYYSYKAQKEAERVNRENERRAAEAAAEEKRRFEINLRLTRQQISEENRRARAAEALSGKKFALEEELGRGELALRQESQAETARQNRVNQAIQLLVGTMQMFNSPANREQNYNFWMQRAAALPKV